MLLLLGSSHLKILLCNSICLLALLHGGFLLDFALLHGGFLGIFSLLKLLFPLLLRSLRLEIVDLVLLALLPLLGNLFSRLGLLLSLFLRVGFLLCLETFSSLGTVTHDLLSILLALLGCIFSFLSGRSLYGGPGSLSLAFSLGRLDSILLVFLDRLELLTLLLGRLLGELLGVCDSLIGLKFGLLLGNFLCNWAHLFFRFNLGDVELEPILLLFAPVDVKLAVFVAVDEVVGGSLQPLEEE